MKKKRKVHLGRPSMTGIYNYCDDTIRGLFSKEWKKVTCKKCLAKRVSSFTWDGPPPLPPKVVMFAIRKIPKNIPDMKTLTYWKKALKPKQGEEIVKVTIELER